MTLFFIGFILGGVFGIITVALVQAAISRIPDDESGN